MIRELIETGIPSNATGIIFSQVAATLGAGFWSDIFTAFQWFYATICAVSLTLCFSGSRIKLVRTCFFTTLLAAEEQLEFSFIRIVISYAFRLYMSESLNNVVLALNLWNFGCMVGLPFYGLLSQKINRRAPLLVVSIFAIAMFITLSTVTGNIVCRQAGFAARDFVSNHLDGSSRKVRAFIPPSTVKQASGQLGMDVFGLDYRHVCLLLMLIGFAVSSAAATHTVLLDLFQIEHDCRCMFLFHGWIVLYGAPQAGVILGNVFFQLLDVQQALFALIAHRLYCMIIMLGCSESKGWEVRSVTEEVGLPCYMKALYYSMYLWPQGCGELSNMTVYMLHDRRHVGSADLGRSCFSSCRDRTLENLVFFHVLTQLLHIPSIGLMFVVIIGTPNPLYISLYQDSFFVGRGLGGCEAYWGIFRPLVPVFVGQYAAIGRIPLFLSFCESMRCLGTFMAINRWTAELFCGNPMACWRSQYLYSHAPFYDSGSDVGNINYSTWYLFTKSQKRQCCCPYRKLKPDAPEKCCPPCCKGPLVEESGGCPCPCCCSSCSA